MYQALLTNRYLSTRVIPFIAVAAVALCTALVIIVVSVMTGFLDMVRDAGKTLMGDVIISYPIQGITHYDLIIEELERLPEVDAATPVVDSWGLVKMPYGDTEVVQVYAIEPESFAAVTGYDESIYWRPPDDERWLGALEHVASEYWADVSPFLDPEFLAAVSRFVDDPFRSALVSMTPPEVREKVADMPQEAMRSELPSLLDPRGWFDLWSREPLLRDLAEVYETGLTLEEEGDPGIVLGIHVSKANERRTDGTYHVLGDGYYWMPDHEVTLTMLPITQQGAVTKPTSRIFPVVNEARFGIYQIDDKRVMIPLDVGQEMLDLDAAQVVDPDDLDPATGEPRVLSSESARATLILISAAPGITPQELKPLVIDVYERVRKDLLDRGVTDAPPTREWGLAIKTWEEQNAQIIGPVEKERNLMRILFSIVYFVCAGLVLVIFWAIVYEKTRDIGILRAVGASRTGILWIFVRYGMIVGVVGSIVGLALAGLIVSRINDIHNAMGSPFPTWAWSAVFVVAGVSLLLTLFLATRGNLLPVVAGALVTIALAGAAAGMMLHQGFLVWDPKVYYFTEIPNQIDFVSAASTMAGAIVFSIVGALIPASRAADFDPVAALRYE